MGSINTHLNNIFDEVKALQDDHVERPDELTAVEEIKFRVSQCADVFGYTKDLDEN